MRVEKNSKQSNTPNKTSTPVRGTPKEALRRYLAKIVRGGSCTERQKDLGLTTSKGYSSVVQSLVDCEPAKPRWRLPLKSAASLLPFALDFGERVAEASQGASLQEACARFRQLILFSLCRILLDQGIPYDEVDSVVIKTSTVQRTRERCCKGILWVHQVICELQIGQSWSLAEATQLFFLGQSLDSLCKAQLISSSVPLSTRELVELSLSNPAKFASQLSGYPRDGACLRTQFTFPMLIFKLLGACNITEGKPS